MQINYEQLASTLIYSQYSKSNNLKKWLNIIPKFYNDNNEALNIINRMYYIDEREGEQLDIIGRVVGIVRRPIINSGDIKFFGYKDTPFTLGYNLAPYFGPGTQPDTIPMPDSLFKTFIKSKVFKNTTSVTLDDIADAIDLIFDFTGSYIVNKRDGSFEVVLTQEPDDNTKVLIDQYDIIPRVVGQRLDGYIVQP